MPRNSSLANVTAMLKAELSLALTPGVGSAEDTRLAMLLGEKQRWLADSFDWPFLEDRWEVAIAFGSRFLSFPTTTVTGDTIGINHERPVLVEVFWSKNWQKVDFGIGSQEYNYLDSNNNPPDVLDPVQRWRYNYQQFEIWPCPSSPQTLRFTGQRLPKAFLTFSGSSSSAAVSPNWSGTLDLDDQLVMLFTAAEYLRQGNKPQWQLVLERAKERMNFIRSSYPRREMTAGMNSGRQQGQYNKIVPVKKILVG